MERVCEELDEAKAEIEKLRGELKAKANLCESLKRAHNEQLAKIQNANAKIDKQAQKLNEKVEEISISKQMYEELKSSMKEKESIINHLSSANDKLRVNCDEKHKKWEEEKRGLVVALDEANSKNTDQERKLLAYKEEVNGLKSLLSALKNKRLEAEKKAEACKELRQRDDTLLKLEEQNKNVQDQLKWKKEQFKHLEEAHEKLRGQLQESIKEWEIEKSTLLDEISTLQTNLDSQTRISQDLQSRLHMCNQALAHEETRRKSLEVQLLETKTSFENVFAEGEEAKFKIECLSDERDKDIASLRDMLGTKEMIHKEMKYQMGRLEEENKELRISLKELQEAQIQEAGASSSLSKLRNKLKGLEQIHRDCSKSVRAKDAELEKMAWDLTNTKSELESKDRVIKELNTELERCHSSIMHLELQNEEKSLMVLVLKSEILESPLKLANEMADMGWENSEWEEEISHFMKQLEMKSAALLKAKKFIAENHEEKLPLQDGLEWQKEMEGVCEELDEAKAEIEKLRAENKVKVELCESLKKSHDERLATIQVANVKIEKQARELNQREEAVSLLMKQLETKSDALVKAEKIIAVDHEEKHQLRDDLERHKEILKESLDEAKAEIEKLKAENKVKVELRQSLKKSHDERLATIQEANVKIEKQAQELNQREEAISLLMKQLEMKSDALVEAKKIIAEDHEEKLQLRDDLERHKEILKESLGFQLRLKEQALQMKLALVKVDDAALDRVNDELAEKFCETNELEFELQIWRSIAERLKATLEENQQLRKQVEVSLLAEVEVEVTLKQEKESLERALEERERRTDDLERQLVLLGQKLKTKETRKEKESISGGVQKEIEYLEQECVRRELEGAILAHIDAERSFEHEKESFHRLVEERNQRSLQKAWEKIAADEVIKEIEIQEKVLMIGELEDDFNNLQKKLESLGKTFSHSKQEREEEIAAELKAKQLETKKLESDWNKLLSDRESLLDVIRSLSEKISEFSVEDMKLMGIWETIVQKLDDNGRRRDLKSDDDDLFDPLKENMNIHPSSTTKRVEVIVEERSPLRALNN